MRKPIMTKESKFDPKTVKDKIEKIIEAFDLYLENSPYRFGRSKHAVMGPIAKILDRAQTGSCSPADLTGYAIRMHEMHRQSNGIISNTARLHLETGILELVNLVEQVPVTAFPKILERIDYGLYYYRRKRTSEWLSEMSQKFEHFLRSKYSTEDELREAWKDKKASFSGVFPSRNNKAYTDGKGTRRQDIDEFWQSLGEQNYEEELE
ncbi:MAG: hypothetical protein GX750_06830 [Clostridia bacterium]|nr:hypothetical protein [Clostridia bacterium]